MKKTGQILREARESKSTSLQEVSIHLKINTKTLKALEMGDKAQLPAKTFLRGFVQSYAQYLKLDLNQIMEVFQDEMGSTHPGMITTQVGPVQPHNNLDHSNQFPVNSMNAHFQSIPKPVTVSPIAPSPTSSVKIKQKSQINDPIPPSISFDPQTWSHSLKIGTAFLVLLIISVIIGIKKTIDKYERETILPKQEKLQADLVVKPSILDTNVTSASNISNTSDTVKPSEADKIIRANIIPPATSSISTHLNISKEVLNLTSKSNVKPEASPVLAVVNTPVPSPTHFVTDNLDSPQEIIIEALDKVVIQYSIDDGPKNSISLLAEKIHTFKAKKNISLNFSDGGSVNLIHNGKDKGVPGNLGQPYMVSFPK